MKNTRENNNHKIEHDTQHTEQNTSNTKSTKQNKHPHTALIPPTHTIRNIYPTNTEGREKQDQVAKQELFAT